MLSLTLEINLLIITTVLPKALSQRYILIMKILSIFCVTSFLVLGSLAADFTYTVTAIKDGKPVPPSDIILTPKPPGSHILSNLSASDITVKGKRANPVSYSGNWCGASTHSTSSQPITSVFGYFTAPVAHIRPSQGTPQWIGRSAVALR